MMNTIFPVKCLRRFLLALTAVMVFGLPAAGAEHLSLPDPEIFQYRDSLQGLNIVTNDGMTVTYGSAVEDICRKAETLARKINPELTKKQLEDMKTLVEKRLWLQQKGSDMRLSGDHGIRHIYGNIQRSLHYLEKYSDGEKLAALVSQVYHDIGYTDPDILVGIPDEDGSQVYASKFDHDTRSWDYFETIDLPFWKSLGLFTGDNLTAMETAVSLHNTTVENYGSHIGKAELTEKEQAAIKSRLRECLDINKNPVTAAVHLSDKLALSEREKMPLIVSRTPEILKYMTQAYGVHLMKKAVEDDIYNDLSQRLLEYSAAAAQNGPAKALYNPAAWTPRDVNPESGKKILAMHLAQIDSSSISIREIDGVPWTFITMKALDYDSLRDLLGGRTATRRFQGFFKDIGVPEEEVQDYLRQAFTGGVKLPDAHLMVRIDGAFMTDEDERQATRKAIADAVNSSPVYRWGLTFRGIRAACKAGNAGDETVGRMNAMLEETGAYASEEVWPYLEA